MSSSQWRRFRRFFFFQAEDGIRDLVRSRGLGDVYKRQATDGARGRRAGHQGGRGQLPLPLRHAERPDGGATLSLIHI